jgi:hypothetical protein
MKAPPYVFVCEQIVYGCLSFEAPDFGPENHTENKQQDIPN